MIFAQANAIPYATIIFSTFLLVKGVNNVARNWDTSMKNKITTVCTTLVAACLSSQVFASGFALVEQNVTNLGLAYSGTAALAIDASTGFYNAAGLTRLNESDVVISAIGVHGDFDFNPTSATSSTGLPITGGGEDAGTIALIPAFHISKRLDPKWVVGFGVTTPFGLETDYEESGIARYMATNTRFLTVNLNPNIAYEISRCLSIGFGANAMYGRADLETMAGFGNGLIADGFQKNHGDGWGYGWNAGLLWSPWESTRVGLNYRSDVTLAMEGNAELLNVGGTVYRLSTVRTRVRLPDTATLSLYHAFTSQWAATADVAWTHWNKFKTLDLSYEPNGIPVGAAAASPVDTSTPEYYENTWRFALGLMYAYSDSWAFKVGAAYDQSPTQDAFRTARIPDNDRIWLAIGATYSVSEALRFDLGYAHLFFKDANLNEIAPLNAVTRSPVSLATLAGNYDASANILGIQMRYDFV